ncbi:acyl carrier protein [Bacillus sp. FSL K6-0273]|uniref:Acyl carrier protein n=1 Tax=Bacillus cereus TaxID=1396 RepID=A0ABD7DNY4_BACCE|nr:MULTISPECIES: acyl carrier protein [Bacillus]MCU4934939.1 acyl carrier protein [Bacillus cereus]MCU5457589.1 acyl carrier protein [Bacillus cereus]MCU5503063.1 acyl carrier protein [Bacillus cereus]MCU5510507.1 acyl carrier protein [Bacillus cereus]MCU5551071.1 acyl carrier protein [Bacillus cereus]
MKNLKEELRTIIAEVIEEEDFQDTDDFVMNLGVDSMMALEIIAQIEQNYQITVNEEYLTRIRSLDAVHELVVQLLESQAKEGATNV